MSGKQGERRFARSIIWLRRDLRLSDHTAFAEATRESDEVQPVFVIDDRIVGELPPDDRRITFIQGCLDQLQAGLEARGGRLLVQKGDPAILIPRLARELQAQAVYVNRDYEPYAKERDAQVAKALAADGRELLAFKDQVIFEGSEIVKKDGEPYKVFTPYSKAWIKALQASRTRQLSERKPDLRRLLPAAKLKAETTSFFDHGFRPQELILAPGEKAARRALKKFEERVGKYHESRNFPAVDGTSTLSVHFRFGTLSIREAVRFCDEHLSAGARTWLNELIWRDFYQMILDQYPQVVGHAFRAEYDKIKWPGTRAHFEAWCEGRTGYPLVDAAMRQLNGTGWMHNRLRMVTAMFLTKDLLVDWRWGERYFAAKLLDYDLASNNGGWQWSASTGCDAQPYFRVFNPESQAKKFDRDGEFTRRFVPELGTDAYPAPIVDHSVQRVRAIKLFKDLKSRPA